MERVLEINVSSLVNDQDYAKCQRCLNFYPHDEVGEHEYWPNHKICKRCVGVLLEIEWSPYIMTGDADCYICENEQEWHDIKAGRKGIPVLS